MNIPKIELGKDNRTLAGKLVSFFKVIIVIWLVIVHGLAALYWTHNRLITEVRSADKVVSPTYK